MNHLKKADRSTGDVISELARQSLRRPRSSGERNGIPLLSARPDTSPVTLEIVNALRDELP
ncbi:CopG family transcriptional regulator (plasmid) [Sinorhizobium meliloti]|uniref:CopG family transcriptional regulator n=1 Tax=Rhizobium meliloti TaxID=382 RepID=UPI00299D1683